MSFARISKIIAKTVVRAGLSVGACVIGGALLEENLIDCIIVGALIGGINGAVESVLDVWMAGTASIEQQRNDDGQITNVIVYDENVTALDSLAGLATFGTPALAWYILTQARETNLSVGLTFETYWAGIGVIAGGYLLMSCCCCCVGAAGMALMAKILPFLLSDRFANKLAGAMNAMHHRVFKDDNHHQAPGRGQVVVITDPIDNFGMTNVITNVGMTNVITNARPTSVVTRMQIGGLPMNHSSMFSIDPVAAAMSRHESRFNDIMRQHDENFANFSMKF